MYKPKNISTKYDFMSCFGESETETIARNVVLLCQKAGDWVTFSWDDYQKFCTHNVSMGEMGRLDRLVSMGYFDSPKKNHYKPNEKFAAYLVGKGYGKK